MKTILLAVTIFGMASAYAQISTHSAQTEQIIEADMINVDGVMKEQKTSDGELESIKSEIQKQKKEVVLNKVKAKSYQELSKSVEKLSETTEEYIEEKKAAQAEIAAYNLKVKCMQSEAPGPECDKVIRRRN